MRSLEAFKKRRDIVPKWLNYTLALLSFFVPLVLIPGEDNLFDKILNFIISFTGPEKEYIHLLAYLICVLLFLVLTGICLQLIGYVLLKKTKE